ncbi:MAG: YraN family protein [Clostridia bacterium]|nr:YraN family protein [Clostridia bacterium]
MSGRHQIGLTGEAQAEKFLCGQGMAVVARRYRAQDGEIDLVLLDGETVVFCEVKTRPAGRRGTGLAAVTPAKQRRMTHAALNFLLEREWMARPVRFDVVEITAQGVCHVPNAFMAAGEGY